MSWPYTCTERTRAYYQELFLPCKDSCRGNLGRHLPWNWSDASHVHIERGNTRVPGLTGAGRPESRKVRVGLRGVPHCF